MDNSFEAEPFSWAQAKTWCETHGMTMPTVYEMCPTWNGNEETGKCPEMASTNAHTWVWSATKDGASALNVALFDMGDEPYAVYWASVPDAYRHAICH